MQQILSHSSLAPCWPLSHGQGKKRTGGPEDDQEATKVGHPERLVTLTLNSKRGEEWLSTLLPKYTLLIRRDLVSRLLRFLSQELTHPPSQKEIPQLS